MADVLSDNVNFSGKLADTIPLHYADIPFGEDFSYLNGNLDEEDYLEDIYVGYRYFDSFDREVRYPFGFGLSYTEFSVAAEEIHCNGREVSVFARVTNSGSVAGKEVVQLYVSVPQNQRHREKQRLIAFSKTGVLAPGETESVTLRFDLGEAASYVEDERAWVLGMGDYLLRLGNSSRNTRVAARLRLPREVTVRQCKRCCAPEKTLRTLVSEWEEEAFCDNLETILVNPAAFETDITDYTAPAVQESEEEKAILDRLSPEEMLQLLLGDGLRTDVTEAFDIAGTAGKTATALLAKGVPNVVFADGPAGLFLIRRCLLMPGGAVMAADVPERYRWGSIGKMAQQQLSAVSAPVVYRYATAWPVEMLLAQTWNTELLKEIGRATGAEMRAFGISVWLAPGMNIHRNPLGGRSFEYYSEDPVLTGEMAAALIQGVQSHSRVGVSVKHFCCNNSEDNRDHINVNVSERALREIYLKGFEIAVRKAQPLTVMSSYNLLNGRYTASRRDLLTDILRCEWGFEGMVMTDWGSTTDKENVPEQCPAAGNDLLMPGNACDREQLEMALAEGRLDARDIRICAARVLRLILQTLPGEE